MNKKKEKEQTVEEIEVLFSKEQILNSNKFKDKRDVLNALLKEDKQYKLSEVKSKLKEFLNKEVN